ncbi:MAG: pentapeptide repeat-containing protein [Candidatus Brocadiales bacterium]|nr:pentapeptide repeat-containing protein [Candidatus Brocadiales bacterium]
MFLPNPAWCLTGLRPRVSGAIFQGWSRAKVVQGSRRPAAHAHVGRHTINCLVDFLYDNNGQMITIVKSFLEYVVAFFAYTAISFVRKMEQKKWNLGRTIFFGLLYLFAGLLCIFLIYTKAHPVFDVMTRWQWPLSGLDEYSTTIITRVDPLSSETITTEIHPAKTLWDWLGLLIIPLILSGGALFFNHQARKSERKIAAKRIQENALQSYIDKISDLILENNLLNAKSILLSNKPAGNINEIVETQQAKEISAFHVAQTITITALRSLEKERRDTVILFLRDSGLSDFILISASLEHINLQGSNLEGFNLSQINLSYSNLRKANLSRANLTNANLFGANLYRVDFSKANLTRADLSASVLRRALFLNSDLSGASLDVVNLRWSHFYGAVLDGASLYRTLVTKRQIFVAKSYTNVILPDGSTIHDNRRKKRPTPRGA